MKIDNLLTEAYDPDDYASFQAFLTELRQKVKDGDYTIRNPRGSGPIRIENGTLIGKNRKSFFFTDFCDRFNVWIAGVHRDESEYQAAYMTSSPGIMFIYYLVDDRNDPNDITADLVYRNLTRVPDLEAAVFHEYQHFLQDANGFHNIGRNIGSCFWSYRKLSWEVDAHTAEFYYKFVKIIKESGTRDDALNALEERGFGMTSQEIAKSSVWVSSVMGGKYADADPVFESIREANLNSSFLKKKLGEAHAVIVDALDHLR